MIKYSETKALIIEDFAEYASAVSTMLRNMGITDCQVVNNGETAIQTCRENTFDIILSDYNLGDKKDGQQVLEELTALNLIPPTCTFIMITAEKTAAMVMAALEFQPDSYLTKPFNAGLLKSRLDNSLRKKQTLAPIQILINKKKWGEAYKNCEVIANSHKKYHIDCKRLQFECLKNVKKFDQAFKLACDVSNGRSTPWSLKSMGTILFLQKKLIKAEDIFHQMVNDFPMALEGYDWLAKIQHQLGKPVDAQKTLQLAVEKSPRLIKRQRYLGQLAEQNNDFETMANAYRQAVKLGQHSMFSDADEYVKLAKSIGSKLKANTNENRKKLITEARTLFEQLETRFKEDSGVQFRGAVAHADFSSIIDDSPTQDKQIANANALFDRIEEHLSADDSIEIAESLKSLGLSQLAECVLEEAVEQYFDNPKFMKKASKLTNNKHLIQNASKANSLNGQAVKLFKSNQFDSAIALFEQAAEIAPNNVNICLNHSQALLKRFQSSSQLVDDLYRSEEVLAGITRLAFTDSRHDRYSELSRLNQLMLQQL